MASRGCRAMPGWSPGSGHAAQPEVIRGKTRAEHMAHSEAPGCRVRLGTRGHVALSENFRRVGCFSFGTRDRWRARVASGGILPAWGIRGHAAGSESIREGRFFSLGTREHVALSE